MFLLYPYISAYKVVYTKGWDLRAGVDVVGNFWYYSIPTYDQYGFAGYTQMDFGQSVNYYLGSTDFSYSNGKLAFSVFYNSIKQNKLNAYEIDINENFYNYGLSLGYTPFKNISVGLTGEVYNDDRFVGLEALFGYGYNFYIGGNVLRGLNGGIDYLMFSSVALKDERFSELKFYLTNRYKSMGILRYETSLTKNLRVKLGAGAIYGDSSYKPLFLVGQEMNQLGRVLGFDLGVYPRSVETKSGRVDWNEVMIYIWLKI